MSLLTLRREVGPCLRLVEGHCVVHTVPLDDGHILRSRRPLYGNNPSVHGAQYVVFTPDGKRALATKFNVHKVSLLDVNGDKVTYTKA
jgi:hypothetical protein